jgi:hypothetical protein
MTIFPELKRLHCPDVSNLRDFSPGKSKPFGLLVQAMYGPKGSEGEESFDIIVCTPGWLMQQNIRANVYSGRHHLICEEFNYDAIYNYLVDVANNSGGKDWAEVACKLGRVGKWEFEDYTM